MLAIGRGCTTHDARWQCRGTSSPKGRRTRTASPEPRRNRSPDTEHGQKRSRSQCKPGTEGDGPPTQTRPRPRHSRAGSAAAPPLHPSAPSQCPDRPRRMGAPGPHWSAKQTRPWTHRLPRRYLRLAPRIASACGAAVVCWSSHHPRRALWEPQRLSTMKRGRCHTAKPLPHPRLHHLRNRSLRNLVLGLASFCAESGMGTMHPMKSLGP
mmetsp:Transcript_29546/g.96546  ORF Transcript_29546/g.96546 Transcript_29546/m.96546 type:complete len:210 (-) Transcript_29546:1643-2272(-)